MIFLPSQGPAEETLSKSDADSDDESVDFSPINDQVWYSSSHSALEVIPHNDVEIHSSTNRHVRKNYGSPLGEGINTKHVSGRKIDKTHTQFALSAGMMLGVRECVGGMTSLSDDDEQRKEPDPLEKQCIQVERIKIPAGAYFVTNEKSSLPYRYKFKAYAPSIFAKIRSLSGVDKQRFLHSICGNGAFIEFVSNAKSGQFFFYSHDGRYMIKTQTQEEKNFLWKILPMYYNHMKSNPYSFLTQFYGMYRVNIPDLGKSIHFVIMKSVFNTEKEIHKIWDLKGSTLGRRSERGDGVHKDLDFVDEGRKLRVGPEIKSSIMNQLTRDAEFLAKMQIMDYSMLLGVHLCNSAESGINQKIPSDESLILRSNTPARRKLRQMIASHGGKEGKLRTFIEGAKQYFGARGAAINIPQTTTGDASKSFHDAPVTNLVTASNITNFHSENGLNENSSSKSYSNRDDMGIVSGSGESAEIFFAGIIDILQFYNARKWGETIMKKAVGNSENEISCVSPEVYAERFVHFMESIIE